MGRWFIMIYNKLPNGYLIYKSNNIITVSTINEIFLSVGCGLCCIGTHNSNQRFKIALIFIEGWNEIT